MENTRHKRASRQTRPKVAGLGLSAGVLFAGIDGSGS
jgi:hypothetical protein